MISVSGNCPMERTSLGPNPILDSKSNAEIGVTCEDPGHVILSPGDSMPGPIPNKVSESIAVNSNSGSLNWVK